MRTDATCEAADTGHDDERITLTQAARETPGRPHLSTIHRWRLRGVRGVRLRTELVGGRRFTTRRWLREFRAACSAAGDGAAGDNAATPTSEPTARRQHAIRAAEAELDAAGI